MRADSAHNGGGLYADGRFIALDNGTVAGNHVLVPIGIVYDGAGGGLYAPGNVGSGSAGLQLQNTLLADNHVVVPGTSYAGLGGGLYISTTAVVVAQYMLLGDNAHRYGVNQAVPDDCLTLLTTLNSLGHNLIETMDNCALSGTTLGNIIGPDPRLGPLQNNGGSTDTQVPLADSPAIDHGDNAACLPIDQRGWHRPISAHCDIGAVEVGLFG